MPFRKNHKASKIKSFLFFLLVALLLWALTKLTREYTGTVRTLIVYHNLPELTIIDEQTPKDLYFDITTNGFELLRYKLKAPIIKIDVKANLNEDSSEAVISNMNLVSLIRNQMNGDLQAKNLSISSLHIALNKIISKKIAVLANAKIGFAEGFKNLDSLRIVPDSVVISGPSSVLRKIHSIETTKLLIKNAKQDIQVNAKLMLPKENNITVQPSVISLEMKVGEFSQIKMVVPIEVINVPANLIIKLIPENMRINFVIAVADFKMVAENDFIILCDYSRRDSIANTMTPFLFHVPTGVRNIELLDSKIDYLIFN